MNKLRLLAAVVIAGAFTLLSTGAAQAYPDGPNVIIRIPSSTLIGGKVVHFSAKTDTAGLVCDWTVKLPGGVHAGVSDTATGTGTSFSGSFLTKPVSKTEKHPLTATCKYNDADLASGSASHRNSVTSAVYVAKSGSTLQAATQTASASATVTLLPLGGGGDGGDGLPNTGGSHLWVLILGGALLVGGGGVLVASRRRHTSDH